MFDNHKLYKILGVDQGASLEDIKKAYKKLAMEHHPDKNKDNVAAAEEKFKEISAAYNVLSNESERAKYNEVGDNNYNNGLLDNDVLAYFKQEKNDLVLKSLGYFEDRYNVDTEQAIAMKFLVDDVLKPSIQ